MAENSDSKPPDLWQLHYRQQDIVKRLDRIEAKLETLGGMVYRIEALERAKPHSNSLLGESTLVRTIILGLLAAVIGLATGRLVPGIFQ